MPFITQGKTNWRFLLIVIILAIIVGGGALWYAKRPEKPYQQPPEIKKPAEEEIIKPEEELPKEEKQTEIPSKEEIVKPTCQNKCSQAGLKKCSGNGYQTCEDYNADNCLEWSPILPCSSEKICKNGTCVLTKDTLLLIVEDSLYNGLAEELNIYSNDVKKEYNFKTLIKTFSSSATVSEIKSYIKQIYTDYKLVGVLLIGNLPNEENFDCVYQEVDGNKCLAMKHSFWISRLTPNSSSKDSLSLLKEYFKRNHDYRTGKYVYKHKILVYTPLLLDLTLGYSLQRREEIKFVEKASLGFFDMYNESSYNFIDIEKEDSDQFYLNEIKKPYEYEIVHFEGHGNQNFHEKNIFSGDIKNTSFFFGELNACSGGDFTVKDYIAGNYLFEGNGLIVNAFPKVGMGAVGQVNKETYYPLSIGEPFFEVSEAHFGDVTLKMRYFGRPSVHQSNDPIINIDHTYVNLTESQPFMKIKIKNLGGSRLKFDVDPKCFTELGEPYPLGGILKPPIEAGLNHFFLEKGQEGEYEVRWDLAGIPPEREGSCKGDLYILSNDPVNPIVNLPLEVGG